MSYRLIVLVFASLLALGACSGDADRHPLDPAADTTVLPANVTTDGSVAAVDVLAALAALPAGVAGRSPRVFALRNEGVLILKVHDTDGTGAAFYRHRVFQGRMEMFARLEYLDEQCLAMSDAAGNRVVLAADATDKVTVPGTWVMCMVFLVELADCAGNPHPGCLASAYYYDLLDC